MAPSRSILPLVLAALVAALPAQQFAERRLADLEELPHDARQFVSVDLDGDGRTDLTTIGPGSGIRIHAGRADATFAAGVVLPTGGRAFLTIAAADFDGDGDRDLVAQDTRGLEAFRNDGNLTFTPIGTSALPQLAGVTFTDQSPLFTDVDQDGIEDLVVQSTVGTLLWTRTAPARFVPANGTLLSGITMPRLARAVDGDFDGDGRNDLLLAVADPGTADLLLLGAPGPRFVPATNANLRPGGSNPAQDVAVADLDGDQDLDVVVIERSTPRLFANLGGARFAELFPPFVPASTTALGITLGDLDRDGDVDAVLHEASHAPSVWYNDTGARFRLDPLAPSAPAATSGTQPLAIDLDGRGGLELLFCSDRGPQLWITVPGATSYRRAAGRLTEPEVAVRPHTAADVDGDGHLDLAGARLPVNGGVGAQNMLGFGDGQGGIDWRPLGTVGAAGRLVFADVDGDGDLDLLGAVGGALGAPFPRSDRLWVNLGNRNFLEVSNQLPRLAEGSNRLLPGDVDGDGDLDVVLIGTRPVLYVNRGNGTFTTGATMPSQASIYSDGVLGDFDRDGDLDVVAVVDDPFFAVQELWRNDGAGGFTRVPGVLLPGAPRTRRIAAGDVDADGDLDLWLAAVDVPDALYLNDGSGAFTAGPTPPPVPTGASQEAHLVDLDEDGDLDALTVRRGNAAGLLGIALVALNDGSGGFTTPPTGAWLHGHEIGRRVLPIDLDADGDLDLAAEQGLWVHRRRDLEMPRLARTGQAFPLRLRALAPGGVTAAVVLQAAPPTAPFVVPGLGVLRVDPTATILVAPPGAVAGDGSARDLALRVPLDPRMVGLPLTAQAVFVEGARLRLSGPAIRTVLF